MRGLAYELTDSSEGIATVTPADLHDLLHLVREHARLYENRKPGGKSQACVEPGRHLGLILGGPKGGGEKSPLITQHRCSVAQTAEVDHKSLTSQRLSGDACEFFVQGSIPYKSVRDLCPRKQVSDIGDGL
jgi:hypothetical protein